MSMAAYPEDEFDWTALEQQLNLDTSNVINVKELGNLQLMDLERDLVEQLKTRNEMLTATTETGRELHSLRAAARIELFHRGLKGV